MSTKVFLQALKATKLKKLEKYLTKQDPYVVFTNKGTGETAKTQTHWDASAEPRWEEKGLENKVELSFANLKEEAVLIQVFNDNKSKTHKVIGEATFDLSKLTNSSSDFEIELSNKEKYAGTLSLKGYYKDESPAETETDRTNKASKSKKQRKAETSDKKTISATTSDEESEEESKDDDKFEDPKKKAKHIDPQNATKLADGNAINLKITAIKGIKLRDVQYIGSQDPYLKVTIGEASKQTKPSSGKNPTWGKKENQELDFDLSYDKGTLVLFQVFDAEMVMKDRIIGSTTLKLDEIINQNNKEKHIELSDPKGKSAGTLVVRIEYTSDSAQDSSSKKNPIQNSQSARGDELIPTDTRKKRKNSKRLQAETNSDKKIGPGEITITVLEGINLKNVQKIGSQDPYAQITLKPWDIVSGKTSQSSGRNPKWSSENVLKVNYPGILPKGKSAELEFTIKDGEWIKDRLIGKGTLSLSGILDGKDIKNKPIEVELEDSKFKSAGKIKCTLDFVSKNETSSNAAVSANVESFEKEGTLVVIAKSAKLTRSVEWTSKQDPFMQVTLKPWGGKPQQARTKCKTNAGKECSWQKEDNNCMKLHYREDNPTGEIPYIHVQVYDEEWVLSHRLIGECNHILSKEVIEKCKTSPIELELELKFKKKSAGKCIISLQFLEGDIPDTCYSTNKKVERFKLDLKANELEEKKKPGEIIVKVERAENLRNRAYFGKQDPFVQCTLLPWQMSAKTQPIWEGGKNVEWTEKQGKTLTLKYQGGPTELVPYMLLQVFDDQPFGGHRLIGERELDISCFMPSKKKGTNEIHAEIYTKKGKSAGKVLVYIDFVPSKGFIGSRSGTMEVNLISINNSAKSGDLFSKSDPYVSIRPQPSLVDIKTHRSVIRENAEAAEYNQKINIPFFDFGVGGIGNKGNLQKLKFDLMDKDVFTSDDLLGRGIKELGEILGSKDYDPTYTHDLDLTSGKKTVGNIYAQLKFIPGKYRGSKIPEAMKQAGFLRVWALEARGLKHVGGMMDLKQDPYLCVTIQPMNKPTPSNPKSWPKTAVADDAGEACIWNMPVDVPISDSQASFVASGDKPGFLHFCVLDKGMVIDTVIGTHVIDIEQYVKNQTKEKKDDTWIPIFDPKNKEQKSGEVRIALEFIEGNLDGATNATIEDLAHMPPGTLHLFFSHANGINPHKAKQASATVSLTGDCSKDCRKRIVKIPACDNQGGKVAWSQSIELPWEPLKVTSGKKSLIDIPSVEINVIGKSGRIIRGTSNLGKCIFPINAFVPRSNDFKAVVKEIPICGENYCENYSTIHLSGLFVPSEKTEKAVRALSELSNLFDKDKKPKVTALPGRLHIRIHEGKSLKRKEFMGKQDPYIKMVQVPGGTTSRTDTSVDGDKNPKWTDSMNNYHKFLIKDALSSTINLAAYDDDTASADDKIGHFQIPVSTIALWCQQQKEEPKLQDKKKLGESKPSDENETRSTKNELWEDYLNAHVGKDTQNYVRPLLLETFNSKKYNTWTRKLFRHYLKCLEGSEGYKEYEEKENTRLKKMIFQFYKDYTDYDDKTIAGRSVFEHLKNMEINEAAVKEVMVKLYKKYAKGVQCPQEVWYHDTRPIEKPNKSDDELTIEILHDLVDFVEPRVDGGLGLIEGTLYLDDNAAGRCDEYLAQLLASNKVKTIDKETFTLISKITITELFCCNYDTSEFKDAFKKVPHEPNSTVTESTKDNVTTDQGVPSKTLWWTLKSSSSSLDARKEVGKVKIEAWFTNDWEPVSSEVAPELLQAGTFCMEVIQAEFKTDKDTFGKQDPYFRAKWKSGKSAADAKESCTSVKNNAGKLVKWDGEEGRMLLKYEAEYGLSAAEAGSTPIIHLECYDKDMMGMKDLIGETMLPLLYFSAHPGQIFSRRISLVNTKVGETTRAAEVSIKFQFLPDSNDKIEPFVKVGEEDDMVEVPPPMAVPGRIIAKVASARGLKDVKWFKKMNPTSHLRLWPDYSTATTKPAKNQDTNPKWEETLTLDTVDGSLGVMEVIVKDNKTTIGSFATPIYSIIRALQNVKGEGKASNREEKHFLENWFPLIKADGDKFERRGEVQLFVCFDSITDSEEEATGGAVQFIPGPSDFHIRIKKAVDLKSVALTGTQDPYVELKGIGWRKPFTRQSQVHENGGRNPIFDFTCSGDMEWNPKDGKVPSLLLMLKDRGTIKNTTIHESIYCLAPWMLAPGQISSSWIPLYPGKGKGGPYKHEKQKGALLLEVQNIPRAKYNNKPKNGIPFSLKAIDNIQNRYKTKAVDGEVHVQVLSARNLIDVQALGTQDPFVKLTLYSGGGRGDGSILFESAKTKPINNGGSNPKWDEDLHLPYSEVGVKECPGSTPMLIVEVWDDNPSLIGDKLIGSCVVPIFSFILAEGQLTDTWYPIINKKGTKSGEIHLGVQFRNKGEKKRVLPSELPENTLNVVVVQCRNLKGDSGNDPQVSVEFIGHDNILKTQVAHGQGTEPVFEERISLTGCLPDARGSYPRLRVTVMEYDSISSNDFIGKMEFSLTKSIMGDSANNIKPQAHQDWFELQDRDGNAGRGEIKLILKRGPFPGDLPSEDKSAGIGKVYVELQSFIGLTNSQGKELRKPFARISSGNGKEIYATRDSGVARKGDLQKEILVLPISTIEQDKSSKPTLTFAAYERKWSLLGNKPTLVAQAAYKKFESLFENPGSETQLTLSLRNEIDGPDLGTLKAGLRYVPKLSGKLRVFVVSVAGISSQEMIGKNDLRVDLAVKNGSTTGELLPESTSTKNNTGSEAEWNENISLLYSNESEKSIPLLQVTVAEVDTITSTNCGVVNINILELLLEAHKKGIGGSSEIEAKTYQLKKNEKISGSIILGIKFFVDTKIFEKVKKEESKQIMALKRIWNKMDVNHDGQLTTEELGNALMNEPECAKFLGVDMDKKQKLDKKSQLRAIHELFDEMNTNDDEIVDYEEFCHYVETKPERDAAKKLQEKELKDRRERALAAQRKQEEEEKRIREEKERQRKKLELETMKAKQRELEARRRAKERKELEAKNRRAERAERDRLAELSRKRAEEEAKNQKEARDRAKLEQASKSVKRKSKTRKRPENVMLWRTRDVLEWLADDLDLPQYASGFAEGAVDGPLLVNLNEDDLCNQLGVNNSLHRRKILIRAARLLEMYKESIGKLGKAKKHKVDKSKSIQNRSNESAELVRLKLAQQYKKDTEMRATQAKKEASKRQIWRFEYDSPNGDYEGLEHSKLLDWYDDFADDYDEFIEKKQEFVSAPEDDDESEMGFRTAMNGVRSRLIHEQDFEEIKSSKRVANLLHKERLELKNGLDVTSETAPAQQIKELPVEYWFQDRPPWWQGELENENHFEGTLEGHNLKSIPEDATEREVLQVVRFAIEDFGAQLYQKKNKQLQKKNPTCKDILSDVYEVFKRLRNNVDDTTEKLSRLKFQGCLKAYLNLKLTWIQFDRLFRLVSPKRGDGTNGTIQFDEFYKAFKYSSPSDLRHSKHNEKKLDSSVKKVLFQICETMMRSKLSLKEAFDGFDRNGSGSISAAEFSSLMLALSDNKITKRQIFDVFNSMDAEFDRKVYLHEFLEYWLVVYTLWLSHLKKNLKKTKNNKSLRGKKDSVSVEHKKLKELIKRVEKTIELTFGKNFEPKPTLPGPYSSLLRKTAMSPQAVKRSLKSVEGNRKDTNMSYVPVRPSRSNSNSTSEEYRMRAQEAIASMVQDKRVEEDDDANHYDDIYYDDSTPRGKGLDAARSMRRIVSSDKKVKKKSNAYGKNDLIRAKKLTNNDVRSWREKNGTQVPINNIEFEY